MPQTITALSHAIAGDVAREQRSTAQAPLGAGAAEQGARWADQLRRLQGQGSDREGPLTLHAELTWM